MSVGARQLAPFAALSATYFAHVGFFNPYLPLWLKDMGVGLMAIGLLTSVQSATRLFAPYFWGWLSDRTGQRVRWLRHGALVATLAATGLWWDWGLTGLALSLLVMFLHTSAMMPLSEAALASLVVTREGHFDARRYGRVRLWGSLGFLLTVLTAGAWFERQGMGSFPAWVVGSLLAVLAAAWWLPPDPPRHPTEAGPQPTHPIGPLLRQPTVAWLFASVFWHVLAHVSVYVFFSLYLDHLGYSKAVIGLLWAVSVVCEIGWFLGQGRWLPVLSLPTWLLVAAALTVLRMGLTAGAATSLVWLVVAQCLHAITFAAHHAVCVTLVHRHFPGPMRGRGQALYTVVGYGLTGVLAGVGGGWLVDHFGLELVFWLAAAAAALAMACAGRVVQLERRAGNR